MVKVVVTAGDSDQTEATSADVFTIAPGPQSVYDFSTGAGTNRFGWGYETGSWPDADGDRTPVSTEISALVGGAYAKISTSNATGDDNDSNRYIAPTPSSGRESTHVFELAIQEDPAEIHDIEIPWEGYADWCTQVELYVWDYVEGQWGDGTGLYGQNQFMDNWAGNRDGFLRRPIPSDFDRYIDAGGHITLLAYAERNVNETFQDYVSVTVSAIDLPGDYNEDLAVDLADYLAFANCMAGADQDPDPLQPCLDTFDFLGDGDVDLEDFAGFQDAMSRY